MSKGRNNQARMPEGKFKKEEQGVVATTPKTVLKTDECTKLGKKCSNRSKKNGGTCSKFGRLCEVTRT